jgi:hypothetical protein
MESDAAGFMAQRGGYDKSGFCGGVAQSRPEFPTRHARSAVVPLRIGSLRSFKRLSDPLATISTAFLDQL